jgi:hypothetical protein
MKITIKANYPSNDVAPERVRFIIEELLRDAEQLSLFSENGAGFSRDIKTLDGRIVGRISFDNA